MWKFLGGVPDAKSDSHWVLKLWARVRLRKWQKLPSCQYLLKSWRFDWVITEKIDITGMIEIAYWKMRCLVGGIRVLLEYVGAGISFSRCLGFYPDLKNLFNGSWRKNVSPITKNWSKIGRKPIMKVNWMLMGPGIGQNGST